MKLDFELLGHHSPTIELQHDGRPVAATIRWHPERNHWYRDEEPGSRDCRLEIWWRSAGLPTRFFYLRADWTDLPDGSSQADDPGTRTYATFAVRLDGAIGAGTDHPELSGLTDTRSLDGTSIRHLPTLRQEVEWAFLAVACITRRMELRWAEQSEHEEQDR